MTTEVTEQDFDAAFGEAATAAEQVTQKAADTTATTEPAAPVDTPSPDTAAQKAADDAAAADAQATADAAAAKKAEEDAAAALAAMSPEDRAAKEAADAAAVAEAKAAEEAAARLTAKAEADEKARKDAEAAAAAAEAAKETPEQKAAREALEASIRPYEPTDEEKRALAEFEKEFPESAAAVKTRLKELGQHMNKQVYDAVQLMHKQFQERLAPVAQTAAAMAEQAHFKALRDAHADYDAIVPKIPEWIKTQPPLLQPVLQNAYDAGDTQSVLDLLATYKAAVKKTAPAETAEQIAAREKAEAAARKAAEDAAALAPVTAKRTTAAPRGSPDKNDFDGAFAEAAAAA